MNHFYAFFKTTSFTLSQCGNLTNATQILREIDFGESGSSKSASFAVLGALDIFM